MEPPREPLRRARSRPVRSELDDEAWLEVLLRESERLSTARHRERLARLVARLRARLPFSEYPLASSALADACAVFDRDSRTRSRLEAMLLGDSLARVAQLERPLAA